MIKRFELKEIVHYSGLPQGREIIDNATGKRGLSLEDVFEEYDKLEKENKKLKTINKGKEQLSNKQDKIIRLLYTQCKYFKEILDEKNIPYVIEETLDKFIEDGVEL